MPMQVWGIPIVANPIDVLQLLRIEVTGQGMQLLKDIKLTGVSNIAVTCPFHKGGQERKPSCGCSTRDVRRDDGSIIPTGTVHCFTCDWTGDLPKFVSNIFGYNDDGVFGYKWITSRFAAIEVERRTSIELDFNRGVQNTRPDTSYIHEEELQKYRLVHDYMYERKLTDAVIAAFDVGYDSENDMITFPVHDQHGNVMLIQKRSVQGKRFDNGSNSAKASTLYGIHMVYKHLEKIDRLFVCESPIDALTCWVYKQPAVATMGAAISDRQVHMLNMLPIRNLVMAQDSDKAGEDARKKMRKLLSGRKLLYNFVLPEGYKDINELDETTFRSAQIVL